MSDNNEAVPNVVVAPAPAEAPPPIRIEAVLTPRLNLAFHQNAVPVLRELVLINDGDAPLEAVELTLASEPAFLAPKTWRIDAVPAGQRYHVPNRCRAGRCHARAVDGGGERDRHHHRLKERKRRRAVGADRAVARTAGAQPVGRRREHPRDDRRLRSAERPSRRARAEEGCRHPAPERQERGAERL